MENQNKPIPIEDRWLEDDLQLNIKGRSQASNKPDNINTTDHG